MRLRMIILILALFAFLSASTGGLLYYFSYRDAAFQKTESNAYTRLTLLTRQLSTHLSEHIKPVKTLSGIRELRTALETTNLETILEAETAFQKGMLLFRGKKYDEAQKAFADALKLSPNDHQVLRVQEPK